MTKLIVTLSAAFTAFMVAPGMAYAEDSASITIRVTIPPIAAAQSARDAGAAGAWTIDKTSGGLMVKLPMVTLSGGSDTQLEEIIVYRSDRNRFILGEIDAEGAVSSINPRQRGFNNGLTQLAFVLSRTTSRTAKQATANIVISSI